MGETAAEEGTTPFTSDGTGYCRDNIYGSYVHGLFDKREIAAALIEAIAGLKGIRVDTDRLTDMASYKETQYDLLADALRKSLDMDRIYEILGIRRDVRGDHT